MMKRLLAVMITATLMAGAAWAGDVEFVWEGASSDKWADTGKWKKDGQTGQDWASGATSNATFNLTTGQTVEVGAATTAGDVAVTGGGEWSFTTTAALTADTLTVDGDGTKLTLGATSNVQTASVTIKNGGILSIGNAKSLTAKAGTGASNLILNDGTLDATAAMTIASDIDLSGGTNTIKAAGATPLSGVISGAGKLVLSGGSFTLSSAANTYTGGTEVANSTVTFSSEDHFGTGDITFTGATTGLTAVTTTGMDVANNMILSGDANTTITNTTLAELELSGDISGAKGLTLATASNMNITLSGTNTYEGGTTIGGGGSVSIASDANLGAAAGDITIGASGATLKLLDNITDMDRTIALGGNNLIIAAGNYNLTNAGAVTGTGTLKVTGNATTETTVSLGDLSGHGTGAITVGDSDKVALEATKLGTASIALNSADNKLILNNSGAASYTTGTISGNGKFIKKGAGDFTLGSSSSLTAKDVEIQAGKFIVDSATTFGLASTGNVAVFDGATLNIATATTLAAATMELKAGSTLSLDAALAVGGNLLDFSSDSILQAGYAVANDTNLITFTDISAHSKLDTSAYNATAFQSYLDKFATTGLVRDVAFAVDSNNVKVTITDKSSADAAGIIGGVMESQGVGDMTEYAKPVAGAWQDIASDYMTNQSDPRFTNETGKSTAALITKLADGGFKVTGDARGAEAATNFLTGMDMAKSIDAAGQTAHRAVGNVFKRIQQNNTLRTAANDAFGSGSAYANSVLNADYANRFWLAGMGMWEKGDRYKGNAGFDYDAYGIQLGYDRVFGALTFGGSFAYANGDYEDKAALANDSEIENYTFNLYGTYNHCSGFFASIVGGYTYSDYDMKSSYAVGAWNKANYGMDTWTIGTTLGYDIRPVANFTITPSVGLYYYNSKSDTFNSTGLNGIQIKSDRTELPLALSMKYDVPMNDCAVVSFEVNGGYTYNFSDKGGKVTALGYNGITGTGNQSTTLKASRHSYNVGAGISYNASRWDAGLKYDYYTSKASDAHVLRAEVGFKF